MKLEEALKKMRLGGHCLFFGGSRVAELDDTFSQGDLLSDAWEAVPVPVTFHTAVKALNAMRKPTSGCGGRATQRGPRKKVKRG